METKITIEIPRSETLQLFSDKTARKIKAEIKKVSKPIRDGRRISGEALFEILQKYKNNCHSKSMGVMKMQENNNARKKAAIELIKSVLEPDGYQYLTLIYSRYEEAAKIAGEIPYSYAWFRIIYAEIRN